MLCRPYLWPCVILLILMEHSKFVAETLAYKTICLHSCKVQKFSTNTGSILNSNYSLFLCFVSCEKLSKKRCPLLSVKGMRATQTYRIPRYRMRPTCSPLWSPNPQHVNTIITKHKIPTKPICLWPSAKPSAFPVYPSLWS